MLLSPDPDQPLTIQDYVKQKTPADTGVFVAFVAGLRTSGSEDAQELEQVG